MFYFGPMVMKLHRIIALCLYLTFDTGTWVAYWARSLTSDHMPIVAAVDSCPDTHIKLQNNIFHGRKIHILVWAFLLHDIGNAHSQSQSNYESEQSFDVDIEICL